jgi:hypothetical protein
VADLINLNRARKERARADKTAKAAENRVAFGRTKAEKSLETARAEKARNALEGHCLKDET